MSRGRLLVSGLSKSHLDFDQMTLDDIDCLIIIFAYHADAHCYLSIRALDPNLH